MMQRLFFDRVNAEAGRTAISGEDHLVSDVLAHKAGTALAVVQLAVTRAQVALNAAVAESVPPATGIGMLSHIQLIRRDPGSRHLVTM
jgi:hypothetical protein